MHIQFFDRTIQEFIDRLQEPASSKVVRALDVLQEFGPFLGMPFSRALGNSLFELRIRGKQEIRLLYTFRLDCIVILLGFVKKSEKIPRRHLSEATAKKNALV